MPTSCAKHPCFTLMLRWSRGFTELCWQAQFRGIGRRIHTPKKKVRHRCSLLKKTCMSGSNMTVKRAIKNEVVFIFNMLWWLAQSWTDGVPSATDASHVQQLLPGHQALGQACLSCCWVCNSSSLNFRSLKLIAVAQPGHQHIHINVVTCYVTLLYLCNVSVFVCSHVFNGSAMAISTEYSTLVPCCLLLQGLCWMTFALLMAGAIALRAWCLQLVLPSAGDLECWCGCRLVAVTCFGRLLTAVSCALSCCVFPSVPCSSTHVGVLPMMLYAYNFVIWLCLEGLFIRYLCSYTSLGNSTWHGSSNLQEFMAIFAHEVYWSSS